MNNFRSKALEELGLMAHLLYRYSAIQVHRDGTVSFFPTWVTIDPGPSTFPIERGRETDVMDSVRAIPSGFFADEGVAVEHQP